MEKILDFQTREIPGEHARGNFRLLLSENETGINGLNAPIQLCGHGNTAGALFCGYQEKVEIKEEGRYRIADVQAVSGTILLDQKKCNRVFQKKAQTYMGIANTVTADTEHSACILPGSDMQTGGTLIQYQETDWNFLKRMASQLGLPLVPDISYYYPRFYLGLPEGEKKELGEILSCDMCFDGRYYAVSGRCTVDRKDFICYDVVTGTRLSLGDRVTYEGRELTVSRKKTELVRGEVIFTYRLAGSSYTWVPWEDNLDYTGMSFVGAIVGTQGEQVEVAFDIDQTAAGGNRYGFAPATGNLMYCMPQKGTKTSLYIGNGNEAQGIATGCIRTNGSTCEGTTIESNGGLVLMAKEGIRLESMTGIAMQGMSDIMALYAEGASSLCVNGSVDMLGRLAGISASKYTGYPPYDDAPKEGEFDWEGFTRNLAIGLGVVAVCAIGAAISIATLGAGSILAGAFIGAGIGALSTTAMKAGEEISTGNVRSAKEALRDVGISAASGFITGAFGAKFPGAHRLVEGVVDTAVSAGERLAYAVFDDSMSWDEKWAYAFDPGQMVADFVTGGDWHNYFNENYGADNVTWESASIQDIIDMPSKITDFSPKQISNLASRNGWTVEPLGKGRLAGIPYEQGGGISMHAPNGSSIYIQYHPGSGHHGVMPYYKISSGKNGIVRYYINGESTIMGKDIEELMQCYDRFVDIVKQISMNANEQIVKLKGTIAADELANDFSEIGMMYAKELLENEWITQEQYTIAKTIDEMLVNMSKRKELWSEEALFNAEEWDECRKKGNLLLKMIE